jgi:hypothetical protein
MEKPQYEQYIHDFIDQNDFKILSTDPTQNFQKNVQTTINKCKNLIQKQKPNYYSNNPESPSLRALIKLHKNPITIRPVVNWTRAPSYPLASRMTKFLKQIICLPNTFNIINTENFLTELKTLDINQYSRMCSFDIKNMYTNIPTEPLINIIKETLRKNDTGTQLTHEISLILNTIQNQNYFTHNNQIIHQKEGLPMGAPTSSILSEIYLQYLEHNYIINILSKFHIQYYSRYVDDIFIMYNDNITKIEDVLNEFNKLQKKIQFTLEIESNNILNYLDISIIRKDKNLEFGIYRKPTTTSTVIHASSCHPTERKKMALNYLLNRVNKYPLSEQNKQTELKIIKQIAHENGYSNSILRQKQRTTLNITENTDNTTTKNNKKWSTFTYTGKETRYITKLFKDTGINIAFKTNNTLSRFTKTKPPIKHNNKYNSPGIYKLKCKDCPPQYIGKTGRSFNVRFKEHIRAIKYNRETSGYAKHILRSGHSYGNMEDTMDVIKVERKGKHLDTLERFHIFQAFKQNTHLNDSNIDVHNPIFNTIYKHQ